MTKTEEFALKRRFIIRLGRALHKYGTPAYRLETHLQDVSQRLGLLSNFMITPTSLTFVLAENDENQEYSHIIRVKPGELDLGSLARLDNLVDELASNQRTLSESLERLDEISDKPNPYNYPLMFLAFGCSSGGFAMLMHTNWSTILWSVVMGCVVALISFWAEKSIRISSILEPFIALVSAVLISVVAYYDDTVDIFLVILSSIIVYIPGLALTIGLSELSARNLMSGTARVVDALMSLFKLFFGAYLGLALVKVFLPDNSYVFTEITPAWTFWFAVSILTLSLTILFKVRSKDFVWSFASGFVAFGSALGGGLLLGAELSGFFGAFILGLYSNLFSRIRNLPSSIAMLPGLVVLVPGSKIYIGLNQAITGTPVMNMTNLGSQSFIIFMSLVAGLIFADVVLPSQKRL